MQRLYDLATTLGVRIEYADLTALNRDGDYNHHTRVIRLQEGMLPRLELCVGLHECGHAYYGDERNMFGYMNNRQERRADEYAAHHLIDPNEYRYAEAKYGTHTNWIAQELGVMQWVVDAFEGSLQRIGDDVYIHPRMGHGQHHTKLRAV